MGGGGRTRVSGLRRPMSVGDLHMRKVNHFLARIFPFRKRKTRRLASLNSTPWVGELYPGHLSHKASNLGGPTHLVPAEILT